MEKQFPGRGKTLATLSYGPQARTNKLVKHEEVKAPPAAPVISGHSVRIGGGVKKGEWRCKICKFKNEDDEACKMCKEPK